MPAPLIVACFLFGQLSHKTCSFLPQTPPLDFHKKRGRAHLSSEYSWDWGLIFRKNSLLDYFSYSSGTSGDEKPTGATWDRDPPESLPPKRYRFLGYLEGILSFWWKFGAPVEHWRGLRGCNTRQSPPWRCTRTHSEVVCDVTVLEDGQIFPIFCITKLT